MIEIIKSEDCSTKGGTRKSDRKKLEDKKKEISTTKEIIRTGAGYRYSYNSSHRRIYKYLIYWDKTNSRQVQKRIEICNICRTVLTEQNRVGGYLICNECHRKKVE